MCRRAGLLDWFKQLELIALEAFKRSPAMSVAFAIQLLFLLCAGSRLEKAQMVFSGREKPSGMPKVMKNSGFPVNDEPNVILASMTCYNDDYEVFASCLHGELSKIGHLFGVLVAENMGAKGLESVLLVQWGDLTIGVTSVAPKHPVPTATCTWGSYAHEHNTIERIEKCYDADYTMWQNCLHKWYAAYHITAGRFDASDLRTASDDYCLFSWNEFQILFRIRAGYHRRK